MNSFPRVVTILLAAGITWPVKGAWQHEVVAANTNPNSISLAVRTVTVFGPGMHAALVERTYVAWRSNGDIMVGSKVGSGWNVERVDSAPISDGRVSVAIDSAGLPHILYSDYNLLTQVRKLRYAKKVPAGTGNCGPSANWQCEALMPQLPNTGVLAIAPNGSRHVLFWDNLRHLLHLQAGTSDPCPISSSFVTDHSQYPSALRFGGNGSAYVAYRNLPSGSPQTYQPYLATNETGAWATEPIDEPAFTTANIDLRTVGSAPSVCYFAKNGQGQPLLRYAKRTTPGNWTRYGVAVTAAPSDCALEMSANGWPEIAFTAAGALVLARQTSIFPFPAFATETVAASGKSPQMARNKSGKLLIAYSSNNSVTVSQEQ